ncbi:MAG: DUF362 domain-containing protein [Nanoarchaeota archaeon]|nr:DUF362 domain-containing protein [Nanoarchaeota archaeon]
MKKEIVSVVKCNSYKPREIKKALKQSFKNLEFDFKQGLKILIKPNILMPAKPSAHITTNPTLLKELCKILKNYNSKIIIAESSAYNTDKAFKVSGIEKACRNYAKILNLEKTKKVQIEIPNKLKKLMLPKILFDVDLIINVAKLKTHSLTKLTCCVKNQYGFIIGESKSSFHKIFTKLKDFSDLLLDINEKIKPELNIIDGVIGLEGNGPGTSGSPIKTGIIISSKDPIAADIVAAKTIGFKENQIPFLKRAKKRNLFNKEIEIIGEKNFKKNYKKPDTFSNSLTRAFLNLLGKPKINFDYEKCIKCGLCAKKCPTKAINLNPFPECNHKKCIGCLCCAEVCPVAAPYLKDSLLRRFIKKITGFS